MLLLYVHIANAFACCCCLRRIKVCALDVHLVFCGALWCVFCCVAAVVVGARIIMLFLSIFETAVNVVSFTRVASCVGADASIHEVASFPRVYVRNKAIS